MYWCGVDGGGTKTTFTLFSDQLIELDRLTLSSLHPGQVSDSEIVMTLETGRTWAFQKAHELEGSQAELGFGLGLAGYGLNEQFRTRLDQAVKTVFADCTYLLMSDVEAGFDSALGNSDGMLLISGTGSIGFCRMGGNMYRSGGWGPFIGDEGSGYWIGKRVIQEVSKQVDGRKPRSILYEMVMEYLALEDPSSLVAATSTGKLSGRTEVASLSHLCSEAYRQGDRAASCIVEDAASELALLVQGLLVQVSDVDAMGHEIPCVFRGGILDHNPELIDLIKAKLTKAKLPVSVKVVEPEYGVELGCVRALMRQRNNS